jgi:hypothetical protein
MYNSRMTRRRPSLLIACVGAALLFAGCRSREVEKDLRITDVNTGWYDAGIVEGQNKLVPSVSFRLRNISDEGISKVQLNAVFHAVNEPAKAWGDTMIRGIGSDELAPGGSGDRLVMRSPLGYTGTEARLVMLKNSQFVDATVSVFGRHGSRNWVKLGEFPIDRQLLTE